MSDVASFLGAAVNVAVDKLSRDHPALARRLNWSVEEVKKNAAHALELARRDLSRQAAVAHFTGQIARQAPAPARHANQPTAWDRAKAAVRQDFDRRIFAVAHPIQALTNDIHEKRLLRGERHLARFNDLFGGGVAGAAADTFEGAAEGIDLVRRYQQGGIIWDEFAKRGRVAPMPKLADWAANAVKPLRDEEQLRPARTFPGRLVAGLPRAAMVLAAPTAVAPALLATQALGSAHATARANNAPDNLRNDAAMISSAAINATAGLLLKGGGRLDPARFIEQQASGHRGDLIVLGGRILARSMGGASVAGAQTTADNLIAKASYDPNRPWNAGIGESAVFGGALGSLGGRKTTRPSQPGSSDASIPSRSFGAYEILAEEPYSGLSRPWHRTLANRTFHSRVNSDQEFGAMMRQTFGDNVLAHMNSGSGARLINPPGAIWHHPYDRPGFVQLLRKSEHTDPRLQHVLHPGPQKGGGYAQHHTAAAAGTDPLQNDRRIGGDQDR